MLRCCSHRDLPLILLQPQGEVRHLDGDHPGHTDSPIAPGHVLLQDGELLQPGPGLVGLRQHVHTGTHEVEAAAVEGGVMGVSLSLAGGRAHDHAAQEATGWLAGLLGATGGGLTGHQAALLALAKGITPRSGVEGLAWRVVDSLVCAAAGGQGHTGLTTECEALVTHTALVAVVATAPRHREVPTGQRAATGTGLIMAVGRTAQSCRESSGEHVSIKNLGSRVTHTQPHPCPHTHTYAVLLQGVPLFSGAWGPDYITIHLGLTAKILFQPDCSLWLSIMSLMSCLKHVRAYTVYACL